MNVSNKNCTTTNKDSTVEDKCAKKFIKDAVDFNLLMKTVLNNGRL